MLKDVSLSSGNTDIGCRIGSGLHLELHTELVASLFHDRDTAAHGLIGHVTREGNVYECIAAELVSGADHQVSTCYEIVVDNKVCCGTDLGKVLVGLACDADDVRSLLLDAAESFSCSGHCLVNNDRLHSRVVGKVDDSLDRGLLLLCEVVGIDRKDYVLFAVLCLESFCSASVVFGLRNRTGNDTDVEILAGCVSCLCRSLSLCLLFLCLCALDRRAGAAAASRK